MTFLIVVVLVLSIALPIISANNDNLAIFWSFVMVVIGVLLLISAIGSTMSVKEAIKDMDRCRKVEHGQKVVNKILKDIISELIVSNGTIDFGDTLDFCKKNKKIAPHSEYVEELLESDVKEKLGELVSSGKVKKHFIGSGQYIYINNSGIGATMQTKTIELNVD